MDSRGITLTEVMIASIVAGIVIAAVVTMYITSLDAWDMSGARLAIQRNGDYAMEWIVKDIRAGSHVTIGAGQTSMTIYRTTATGDSTMGHYELDGTQIRNMHDVVIADDVTTLRFTSGNGVKVRIEMTLYDDLDTPATDADDKIIELESVAVCRNQSLY
jgi:Tfp pilus assembly protein PilE